MKYHAIILTDALEKYKTKPLGAYVIASVLRDQGYNVLVIDMLTSFTIPELKEYLSLIISEETLFVGYSSTFFYDNPIKNKNGVLIHSDEEFIEINQYIKSRNPNIEIIWGGACSRDFVKQVIKRKNNFGIDYVMYGFSEAMIIDFVRAIEGNKPKKISNKIQGIGIIDYDFKGVLHNFRNSSYHFIEDDIIAPEEPLTIEIARGCIFKCKFCSYPLLGRNKNDDSYIRLEETLLNEILENYDKFKTLHYNIADDTFNERTDKIEMMLRVRDRSKLNLSFAAFTRIDLMHRMTHQIELMKDLNLIGHSFGIETLYHPSAKLIGKGIKPEDVIETLHKTKKIYNDRVILQGNFIIGLPYETPSITEEWTSKVLSNDFPLDWAAFTALTLSQTFEASEFMKNIESYGYRRIPDKYWEWENDLWTYGDCNQLAFRLNMKSLELERTKLAIYRIGGAIRYGVTLEQTLTLSKQKIDQIVDDNKLEAKYIEYYKKRLNEVVKRLD